MTSGQTAAEEFRSENRLTVAYLTVAHVALLIGVVLGLFQALEYAGISLYPLVSPLIQSYYYGLSLHGVLNVLVWTTFFISGFLTLVIVQAVGTPLQGTVLGWAAFALMVAGLVITAVPQLSNQATVLFTFTTKSRMRASSSTTRISPVGLMIFVGPPWSSLLIHISSPSFAGGWLLWNAAHPNPQTFPIGSGQTTAQVMMIPTTGLLLRVRL